MALMAPKSSAKKAFSFPIFSEKQSMNWALLFLNIPPQADEEEVADPSVLHFTQLRMGGCQRTSMILGALGGRMLTINFFRIVKSYIDEDALLLVRLPAMFELEEMTETELLQVTILSFNLAWFLANQKTLNILIRAVVMTTLHYWLLAFLQTDQISSLLWNCRVQFKVWANQFQIWMT